MAGRESEYTKAIAAEICRRIEVGRSVLDISQDAGMPSQQTIYKWRREFNEFAEMYARAREAQADTFVDEIIHIVDTEPDPNRARVRMDARKWHASKHAPKKYGDKLDLNNTHGVTDTLASLMEKIGQNGRRIHDKKPEGEGE